MRKITIYPYDVSNLHLLLHKAMIDISDDDVIECVSPKGWGYENEDAGYKVGIETGVLVKSDFDSLVNEMDVLIIVESIFPLPGLDIAEKIENVLAGGKRVVVLRKMDVDLERQLIEKSCVDRNLEVYTGNRLKPYTDIEMADTSIEEIPAAIILVLGSGERCCKFDVQLALREALLENGYALTQIGSKNYCEFFGFHSFPGFMLDHSEYTEREKIIGFNKYVKMLYMLERPDVLVIGVPGGAFSFDEYFDNNFGITNFYVSNAIIPDYVIYNSLYVDTLPEFLETMKKNLNNRYGYETDQIFISNYALNYPASKSEQVLTYLTCKTSDLLAGVNGLDIYNIYDCNSKKNSINKLISTLQEYAGISVI